MKNFIKVLFVLILIGAVGFGIYWFGTGKNNAGSTAEDFLAAEETNLEIEQNQEVEEVKEPEIKIFNGNDRPIAFMIDNNKNAQPQASLNSTYMVYEIIVEGGESRLMALFKGVTADEVGPIRSARHYFIDYAMENDALYAHLGMSPQAQATFQEFGIQHINGQVYDTGKARTESSLYWRVSHKKAPHNAYTNIPSILSTNFHGLKQDWMKHMLESSLLGEIPITSDRQMMPP